MALGDQAGKISVDEIDSVTLPAEAKIINDALIQVAVIVNGALNGVEVERAALTQNLHDELAPVLVELAAWRVQLSRFGDILERLSLKP